MDARRCSGCAATPAACSCRCGDATNGTETYGAGRYLLDAREERRPRRRRGRRHARRRPELRVPAVVRVRPAVGLPARPAGEPRSPSASRPASGCADATALTRPRYHEVMPSPAAIDLTDRRARVPRAPDRRHRSPPSTRTAPRARPSSGSGSTPDGRILAQQPHAGAAGATNLAARRPRVAIVGRRPPRRATAGSGSTAEVDEVVDDVERARDDIVALAHRYQPGGPDRGVDRAVPQPAAGHVPASG